MSNFKKEQVDAMFAKVNKGIWESKKWRAKEITKSILVGVWTVTIFPLILLWMFIMEER
jgi:hypothetical protein